MIYLCYTIVYQCYKIVYLCYKIVYQCYKIVYLCYKIVYQCYKKRLIEIDLSLSPGPWLLFINEKSNQINEFKIVGTPVYTYLYTPYCSTRINSSPLIANKGTLRNWFKTNSQFLQFLWVTKIQGTL